MLTEPTSRSTTDTAGGALPAVFCVLVNWNGWADTAACLRSLAVQEYAALRVLVVDNGSKDDSVARIRAEFSWATVIEAGSNLGFACGSNAGIRYAVAAGAEYVWLLNNDTIAPPDSCSKLVRKAQANPRAGLIGSVLYRMDTPAEVQAWGGGELNVLLGRSSHALAPFVLGQKSYLTFASVLVPRAVLERVGVLYEGYFMYWDDGDYALRVTRAGYALAVAEDTAILHKEGGSAEAKSPVIDRYSVAAGMHFLRRHSPMPPLSMAIFVAVKFASRLAKGRWKNARAVLAAVGDYERQRRTVYSDQL
jgi:GT2 family glycosyltransferase